MTNDEMRVVLAKWAGWKWYKFTREDGTFFCQLIEPKATWPERLYQGVMVETPVGESPDSSGAPNYPEFLDLVATLEARLTKDQWRPYVDALWKIVEHPKNEDRGEIWPLKAGYFVMLTATAEQRCRALVAALNLSL